MKARTGQRVAAAAAVAAMVLMAWGAVDAAGASSFSEPTRYDEPGGEAAAPFAGPVRYPFTKKASQKCAYWARGSQDYPYFGAPREGNSRRHAGIDLYPVMGAGTPIRAIREGTVLRIAPFYVRTNGEVTYGLFVDHKEYIAVYAELMTPNLVTGAAVERNQVMGFLSGTRQLHFELYQPGTIGRIFWYGQRPPNLIDPTGMMRKVFTQ